MGDFAEFLDFLLTDCAVDIKSLEAKAQEAVERKLGRIDLPEETINKLMMLFGCLIGSSMTALLYRYHEWVTEFHKGA